MKKVHQANTRQASARPAIPRRILVGQVPISQVDPVEVCPILDSLVHDETPHYVCFCESHLWVCAMRDRSVLQALEQASVVLPDGISMIFGSRLYGAALPRRAPGPTILLEYCRHGVGQGLRHFFCGGAPGVAEKLATTLQTDIPGLEVAGVYCPPFRPMTQAEEDEFQKLVQTCRPDVLWVGLGAPKQELWMTSQIRRLGVPLMLGVGAAFDFHSGQRKWAPTWVREMGLEWAFRTLTGGRATMIRNLKCLPQFAVMISLNSAKSRWLDA